MHVLKEIQPGTSQVLHDVGDVTCKKGCDSSREHSRPIEHRPELELSTRAAKRLCTGFKGKLNDLFDGDKSLKDVEWSLSYELTRTSDGGTDKTRISELASLVKALRKAVRAYQQKVKELHQFVASEEIRVTESSNTVDLNDPDESSPAAAAQNGSEEEKLALEKTISTLTMQIKQLQVEVGTLEGRLKDMGIKNNLKVAAVEEEAMRLKRDLLEERCKSTQLQASEKASKAAAERAESELHSLREGTAKQLSDANANKGELWKQMMHHKDQADKERKTLFDQLTDAQSALEAVQLKYETERGRVSMLEDDKVKLKKQLEKAELEVEECEKKMLEYSKDLVRIQEQEEIAKKQSAATASELASALAAAAKAKADKEEVTVRASSWENKFETAEGARVAAEQQVAQYKQELQLLAKDAEGLKDALVSVTSERNSLDSSLAEALKELEESAGKYSKVEAEVEAERATMLAENEALRAENEELGAKLTAQSHAKTAAEDKALALEAQMEALQDVVGAGDQKQMVGQLVTRVGHLETALWEAEKSRRRNHNELMEVKGNIRVFCRLRPSSGAAAVDPLHGDGVRCLVDGKAHDFYFDRVLPSNTSQETVFSGVSDVIQSALDGYQVCLFSYGQTGSGKTYTMNGNAGAPGIIPRAVSMLLEASERLGSVGWNFRLEATFIEVYNDVLRDLLAPVKAGAVGGTGARVLDSAAIKHDPKSHTQVIGATKILVDSEAQARELLARAQKARSTDATAMNAESSRSHSVFTLCITGEHEEKGFKLLGSLNLVDLAGSERLARSQAEGQRQKETCAINKSLACLGDIFQALATKSGHIPYRNSKLTYLLQPCLGGDGKTLMFININPEAPSAYESLCALRFASKVNTVETGARGGAKRNVVSSAIASPADHGAVPGGPGAGGPGALPPLHRGSSDGTLGNRTGLPRPSTGGTGTGRQSIAGRRDSIAPSHSRGSSSSKGSGARSSLAPAMSGRSSSVPVYKRQR